MRKPSGLFYAFLATALTAGYVVPATAQTYPTRAITLIVPAAAGGPKKRCVVC